MTPKERHLYEFMSALNAIKTGPDGYPVAYEMLPLELHVLGLKALEVDQLFLGREDLNAEQRSALNLADATSKWITETTNNTRDPDIAQEWYRARGGQA